MNSYRSRLSYLLSAFAMALLVSVASPALRANSTKITVSSGNVTASDDDGNVPANTVDANLGTRWSASGDPEWIRFDMGVSKTVDFVKIAFYNGDEREANFDVQVSTDGSSWTTVLSDQDSSGTTTALETFDFADTTGRYVRIVGHGNSDNDWNSYTEVEIYGYDPGPPSVKLTIADIFDSENDGNLPANVLDGNLSTRWSANGDPQWLWLDLGSSATLDYLKMAFYKGDEREAVFDVDVSIDTTNWTTVLSGQHSSGSSTALETFNFTDVSARYVLITGHGNTDNGWNSYTEVEAYGITGPPTSAPATPTGLDANAVSSTQINVTWNPSVDATGYDIEKDSVVADNGSATSYSDTGLSPSSSHSYRVRAKNSIGTSAWTSTVSESTPASGNGYDQFGVQMLFPTSTNSNRSEWFLASDPNDDPQMELDGHSDDATQHTQNNITYWTKKLKGSGSSRTVRFNVLPYTNQQTMGDPTQEKSYSYDISTIQSRGYMCTPDAFRNTEITGYFRIGSNIGNDDDAISIKMRGGQHTSSNTSKARCVGSLLCFDGTADNLFEKELVHNDYDKLDVDFESTAEDFTNPRVWVGVKSVNFNNSSGNGSSITVTHRIYVDWNPFDASGNPNNNWELLWEYVDDSNSVSSGNNHPICNWSGVYDTFRIDECDSVDFCKLSEREIIPPNW